MVGIEFGKSLFLNFENVEPIGHVFSGETFVLVVVFHVNGHSDVGSRFGSQKGAADLVPEFRRVEMNMGVLFGERDLLSSENGTVVNLHRVRLHGTPSINGNERRVFLAETLHGPVDIFVREGEDRFFHNKVLGIHKSDFRANLEGHVHDKRFSFIDLREGNLGSFQENQLVLLDECIDNLRDEIFQSLRVDGLFTHHHLENTTWDVPFPKSFDVCRFA